jgi:hypothetical protein
MKGSHPLLRLMLGGVLVVGGVAGQSSSPGASAQEAYQSGQNVVPVYEGWEPNPDGSFNLVFGYFNRNWEEEIDLPVGPNTRIEPAAPIKDSRRISLRGATGFSSRFACRRISVTRSWSGR